MRRNTLVVTLSAVIFTCLGNGCGEDTSVATQDMTIEERFVYNAGKHLTESKRWLIPPDSVVAGGGDGKTANSWGAVAYSYEYGIGPGPSHESIISFNDKLNLSSDPSPELQNDWHDYKKVSEGGFPGGVYPYAAGFCCWCLVWRAANAAGYSVDPMCDADCYATSYQIINPDSPDYDEIKIGDIVAYDFDNDDTFDHVGVISDNSSIYWQDYYSINILGYAEVFWYGASQLELDVFNEENFVDWPYGDWGEYTVRIVRLPKPE
jgi:cell wall-associated NlpC family hydrolase